MPTEPNPNPNPNPDPDPNPNPDPDPDQEGIKRDMKSLRSSSDALCSAVKAALCGEPSPDPLPELPCASRASCLLLSWLGLG